MVKSLLEGRFQLAEQVRTVWAATVPGGTTREAILDPEFWAHISQRLHPMDEILVLDDNCASRLHLLVIDNWVNGAKVQILSETNLLPIDEAKHEHGLKPAWRGPHYRWCVVREDGTVLKNGLISKAQAQQEMGNYLGSMRV